MSRVIKYVGILGYRYQSYGLVDMRIHDIRVVADLTRSNPTAPAPGEPVECDGSHIGSIIGSTQSAYNDASQEAAQKIATEWTLEMFWPVLQVVSSYPILKAVNIFHFTFDLLGLDSIYTGDTALPDEEDISQEDTTVLSTFVAGLVVYLLVKAYLP